MPLRITLKPHERVIINGAMIRNGDRSSYILVETQCRFLRESDFVDDKHFDTLSGKICLQMQELHLSQHADKLPQSFYDTARIVSKKAPELANIMLKIEDALSKDDTYAAIKLGKQLMLKEAELSNDI